MPAFAGIFHFRDLLVNLTAYDASFSAGINYLNDHLFSITSIIPTHDASKKAGIGIY